MHSKVAEKIHRGSSWHSLKSLLAQRYVQRVLALKDHLNVKLDVYLIDGFRDGSVVDQESDLEFFADIKVGLREQHCNICEVLTAKS